MKPTGCLKNSTIYQDTKGYYIVPHYDTEGNPYKVYITPKRP